MELILSADLGDHLIQGPFLGSTDEHEKTMSTQVSTLLLAPHAKVALRPANIEVLLLMIAEAYRTSFYKGARSSRPIKRMHTTNTPFYSC